jgi:hypothetical protein
MLAGLLKIEAAGMIMEALLIQKAVDETRNRRWLEGADFP